MVKGLEIFTLKLTSCLWDIDFMKQIIEEVFKAEQKVDEILRQAREKALQIKQSAEKTGIDNINEAKQKMREIINSAIENAKKEAESIRQEKLKQAEAQKDAMLSKGDEINKLIDDICGIVMKTEL
jgi:vacuolar-type H+-ATPase subunit H